MPVLVVTESQTIDAAGQLQDVYEITYSLPDKPGAFTVNVPKTADALAAAEKAINDLTATVGGIYGIA